MIYLESLYCRPLAWLKMETRHEDSEGEPPCFVGSPGRRTDRDQAPDASKRVPGQALLPARRSYLPDTHLR